MVIVVKTRECICNSTILNCSDNVALILRVSPKGVVFVYFDDERISKIVPL